MAGAEPGVSLGYWPVRQPGEHIVVTGSNRDYLGVITAIGRGVRGLKVGERVAYVWPSPGAYSELRNVPAERVVRVPR